MEHFVTLFDQAFLPQGLALHRSLLRVLPDAQLWILCIDDAAHAVLAKLALPQVRLLRLSEHETPDLLAAKANRNAREYCWTLTPFAPRFVFEADAAVARVTYIDADLWFRKPPQPLFRALEAAGKHVLITDHGYAPEHDQSQVSGQYCVQFITFTRAGDLVRRDWEMKCLDWCHDYVEDGKFGDQRYLDAWPEDFPDHVHILDDRELTLAPWNVTRFPYGNAVFYHFHGLRILTDMTADLTSYPLPAVVRQHIYGPYLDDLRLAIAALRAAGHTVKPQKTVKPPSLKHRLRNWILRRPPADRPSLL